MLVNRHFVRTSARTKCSVSLWETDGRRVEMDTAVVWRGGFVTAAPLGFRWCVNAVEVPKKCKNFTSRFGDKWTFDW